MPVQWGHDEQFKAGLDSFKCVNYHVEKIAGSRNALSDGSGAVTEIDVRGGNAGSIKSASIRGGMVWMHQ